MRRIAIVTALMTLTVPALANEVLRVPVRTVVHKTPSVARERVATTSGTFGRFTISLVTTVAGKPMTPTEIRVAVDGHMTIVEPTLFGKALNPKLNEIGAIADSGIFGTFFTLYIPFGDRKRCTFRGEKVNARASLNIDFETDGKVDQVSIFDPCSE